jgi:hypothetical protein
MSEVQAAIPDVASLPLQLTPTGWLYQPLKSGPRATLALSPAGGWASILIVLVVHETDPPPIRVAVHVRVVPMFGPSILMAASQPDVETITPPGSLTDQWRTT